MGTFEEEDLAFDTLIRFTWLLPSIVAITTVVDGIIMAVLITMLHPWGRILEKVWTIVKT